jgi:hypothetical protein
MLGDRVQEFEKETSFTIGFCDGIVHPANDFGC